MSIKVIGAGFPRTGTSTMKQALQVLGFDECYHMKNLITDPYKLKYWNEIEQTGKTDWDSLFDGFQSIVDIPGYLHYKQMMDEFPDAKVILTVRPFEKWYSSMNATVYSAVYPSIGEKLSLVSKMIFSARMRAAFKCIMMVERTLFKGQFLGKFKDKASAERIYNEHLESVKKHVPNDRLLVFEVKEGWEPLCNFLGVSIPNESFPHLNKKENFKEMLGHLIKGEMV